MYLLSHILLVSSSCWVVLRAAPRLCYVAEALSHAGFPREGLEDWVCLVMHASYGITNKMTLHMDGHISYGLFAINDTFWCSNEDPYNSGCGITCLQQMRASTAEQSWCATHVHNTDGFMAWYEWRLHCRGGKLTLPNLSVCEADTSDDAY